METPAPYSPISTESIVVTWKSFLIILKEIMCFVIPIRVRLPGGLVEILRVVKMNQMDRPYVSWKYSFKLTEVKKMLAGT
jgi:hypothetical protein